MRPFLIGHESWYMGMSKHKLTSAIQGEVGIVKGMEGEIAIPLAPLTGYFLSPTEASIRAKGMEIDHEKRVRPLLFTKEYLD